MNKKIGLFFGSFNPIHIGHLIIANFMATQTDLNEVWIVVSPQNPFKQKKSLANNYDRLHLVELAIAGNSRLRTSKIEFGLPQPSYTVDTLAYLKEQYPEKQFSLIMGGDNLATLHKWKNYELILRYHDIYVYQRPGYETDKYEFYPNVKSFDVPLMQISASYIRKCIKEGHSVRYLVPDPVFDYLASSSMYKS